MYTEFFNNKGTPVSVTASPMAPVYVRKTQLLAIGNEKEVEEFYNVRFKDMQQCACKVMGKAFVKLVEPKKQTHYPYTKGDTQAPPWWPKATSSNKVPHKEPDHLLKPERIHLLVHILKMIVEPHNKRCPTVGSLGLNVEKLEKVTMDALDKWFTDPQNPGNASKKPFLREIFIVAKVQERYKNGDIDGNTRVPVMFGGWDFSDAEIEQGAKYEDEEPESARIPSKPIPESRVDSMAASTFSQPLMGSQHLQQTQMADENPMFIGATSAPPLLASRYHPQAHMGEHQAYPSPAYLDTMAFEPQAAPNSQSPVHSTFASPHYSSPHSMYGWQSNTMVNNGTVSFNYCVTPTQPWYDLLQGSWSEQFQPPPPPTGCQPIVPLVAQQHFNNFPLGRQFAAGVGGGDYFHTGGVATHHHYMPQMCQDYF